MIFVCSGDTELGECDSKQSFSEESWDRIPGQSSSPFLGCSKQLKQHGTWIALVQVGQLMFSKQSMEPPWDLSPTQGSGFPKFFMVLSCLNLTIWYPGKRVLVETDAWAENEQSSS